jgi:ATP-dependent DNA helicase RecG
VIIGSMQQTSSPSLTLETPVQYLKGVGPTRAEALAELGVGTVRELLEYYPRDWVFMPEPIPIARMQEGQKVSLMGLVESTDYLSHRRKPVFEVMLADETGYCRVLWFHGGYLVNQLEPGKYILVHGTVSKYKHMLQLTNPKFIILEGPRAEAGEPFSGPVYPASGKLPSWQIRRVIRSHLAEAAALMPELYPAGFLKKNELIARTEAFGQIHEPADEEQLARAKRRLKYDELFLMQMGLALKRFHLRHSSPAAVITVNDEIDGRIRRRFPFLLTEDQNQVIAEVCADLAKSVPMNRLLQGDVGSGKTVVALYAALAAVANKQQVAIMAPTEILARQHYDSMERFLKDSRVRRELITGGITGKKRQELTERILQGEVDIVVGTVALLAGGY